LYVFAIFFGFPLCAAMDSLVGYWSLFLWKEIPSLTVLGKLIQIINTIGVRMSIELRE